jgi:predicted nucleic acid-binding protein
MQTTLTRRCQTAIPAPIRKRHDIRVGDRLVWLDDDEPILLTAARIQAKYRLSLADAMIAAFAIQVKATLVHKDPEFESFADFLLLEALPYKAVL